MLSSELASLNNFAFLDGRVQELHTQVAAFAWIRVAFLLAHNKAYPFIPYTKSVTLDKDENQIVKVKLFGLELPALVWLAGPNIRFDPTQMLELNSFTGLGDPLRVSNHNGFFLPIVTQLQRVVSLVLGNHACLMEPCVSSDSSLSKCTPSVILRK